MNSLYSKITSHCFLIASTSGVILALAYDFPRYGWPIIFVGLLPLFALLEKQPLSKKKVFFIGYLFGTVYIAGTTLWLLQSFPLDWANISSPFLSSVLVIIAWLIIASTLGIFFGLWALVFHKLRTGNNLIDIFLSASLWILFEYFRTIAFSLVSVGSESTIGAHFSFGVLGHSLAWSPFLFLASLGGTYLLSFFVVIINALLFLFIKNFNSVRIRAQFKNLFSKVSFPISILITLLICSFLWQVSLSQKNSPPSKQSEETISIALVHTNFTERVSEDLHFEEMKFTVLNQLLTKIKKSGQSPDMLIFPEDARFLISLAPESRYPLFSDALGDGEKTIIDSAHAINHGKIIPTAYFYNTKTDTLTTSEKQILIPNGEYLPWIAMVPLQIAGLRDTIQSFLETRGFEKGNPATSAQHSTLRINTLLCSEIFSSSLLQEEPFNKSDIIINLSSHAIFHGSALLENQTLALAKIRAVEIGQPVIVAGNMTPSLAIDSRGAIVALNDSAAPSVSYISLPLSGEITFSQKYSNWVLMFSIFFIFLQILFRSLTTTENI